MTVVAPVAPPSSGGRDAGTATRRLGVPAVFTLGLAAVAAVAAVHLTQGTSQVDALDLVRLVTGQGTDQSAAVFVASRLPRLLAGVLVGAALGVAGAALQSLARNPLASPDTLGVNAGAYLAVVAVAAFGVTLPAAPAVAVAFVGGLAAAGLVMLLAGGVAGPTRLVLAGSAVALALAALTTLLLLLFQESTVGLFAWGSGSLVQSDLDAVAQMAPVVVVAAVAALVLSRRLDLLALGDDTAAVLGVAIRRTRLAVTLLAVLLSSAAVTVAGPIGFVGLVAPVLVRLSASRVPGVHRHRVLLPLSAVTGVLVVVGADVLLRAVLGAQAGVDIPTGVVTTFVGAVVLVWLARRHRDSGPTRRPPSARGATLRSRGAAAAIVGGVGAAVALAGVLGMLAGDTWVLGGDIVNWMNGRSGRAITYVLDTRFPRMVAALLAGAALAVAGTTVQAVCRNPLAEPGILGITAGAGVGAVLVLTLVPAAGLWTLSAAAAFGALAAFALVYGLAWRGGLSSDRLVLIGVGVSAGAAALITLVILVTDPWNSALALTWLSGSTYGRTLPQVLPVLVALLVISPLMVLARRRLDLLSLDEDTPRILGVRLERARLSALVGSALLTATAVSAVGVIGFVGLVAPHMARALVGSRHARVLPVAALLGALLVSVADTVGRTVIAPAQVPAGLLTALIGAPYFVWLLWRSRAAS